MTILSSFALGLLAILIATSSVSGQTACGCWSVDTGATYKCSSKGCSSSYPVEYCATGGCLYGHCGVTGYGLCCNTSWMTYGVYGATQCGGNQNCGTGCGLIKSHASSVAGGRPGHAKSGLQKVSRGSAGPNQGYLVYEPALLVPNHCRHTYGRIYPKKLGRLTTSSTRAVESNVSRGGN